MVVGAVVVGEVVDAIRRVYAAGLVQIHGLTFPQSSTYKLFAFTGRHAVPGRTP